MVFLIYFQCQHWRPGWPLTVAGAVVLHLGAIDESLLRPEDLYICIKLNDQCVPQLCAVWRDLPTLKVVYHYLDPLHDSFSPIGLEMLAEELPQLLQSLLVGVEHAINRVPLDELTFYHKDDDGKLLNTSNSNNIIKTDAQHLSLTPIGSPKCGLKRRELITKNKSINKYAALKRMSNKSENDKINNTHSVKTQNDDGGGGGNDGVETEATIVSYGSPEPTSNLPLFCLGRSFPHIDSDEESGDDMIKSNTVESGKFSYICVCAIHVYVIKLLL